MKLPYIKWYFRDAAADLRLLDSSPRCVWYEMLWIMAASDRYGYLERQGRPMTDEEIARSCGLSVAEIEAARPVLLADGIPSVEPATGVWFCRRMADDERKRTACADAGKRGGGSPLLASSPEASELDSDTRTQNPYKPKGAPYRSPLKVGFKGRDTFDDFWQEYPRKVGKEAARKAWSKAADSLPAILEALAWQRVSEGWTKDSGAFVPHPSTYLNGRRWEDQRPAADLARIAAEARRKDEAAEHRKQQIEADAAMARIEAMVQAPTPEMLERAEAYATGATARLSQDTRLRMAAAEMIEGEC